MEKERIEQSLLKMGYRELKQGIWAKPVAFHLFLFEMDKMLWTNFFRGTENTMCIWNTETYKEDDYKIKDSNISAFLSFLKYTEQYTRIDTRNVDSEFEFFTEKEIYKQLL
jgi:NAD-dependent SIR2 family protein deacetylase